MILKCRKQKSKFKRSENTIFCIINSPPKLVSPISINSVYSADSTSPSLVYSILPLPSLPQRPGERTRAKSSDFSLEFLLSSPVDNPTTIEAMKNAQQVWTKHKNADHSFI